MSDIRVGLKVEGDGGAKQAAADLQRIKDALISMGASSAQIDALARTLSLTRDQAASLATQLGLTGANMAQIVAKFNLLERVSGSVRDQFAQIAKSLSPEAFLAYNQAIAQSTKIQGELNAANKAANELLKDQSKLIGATADQQDRLAAAAKAGVAAEESLARAIKVAANAALDYQKAVKTGVDVAAATQNNTTAQNNLVKAAQAANAAQQQLNTGLSSFNSTQVAQAQKTTTSFTGLAFQFNQILLTLQTIGQVGAQVYSALIGSNEELRKSILSAQASLAAVVDITVDGKRVEGVTNQINATSEQFRATFKQLELDSEQIVGVTPEQINQVFQTTSDNVSQIVNQSKQIPNIFDAMRETTKSFTAALTLANIPIFQQRQELQSIFLGQIDHNSILAKRLNITSKDVNLWKEQGILVDELNKKLAVFVEANKLGATSIENVTSNITGLFQRLARDAGEPLLLPLSAALNKLFDFLKANEGALTSFFSSFLTGSAAGAGEIISKLKPALDVIFEIVVNGAAAIQGVTAVALEGGATISSMLSGITAVMLSLVNTIVKGNAAFFELVQLSKINDISDALATIGESTNAISDSALKTAGSLKPLNDILAENKQLSAEQLAARKELLRIAGNELSAIDANIARLKELNILDKDNAAARDVQIKQLELVRAALQRQGAQVSVASRSLEELGTSNQQLADKTKAALRSIATDGGGVADVLKKSFTDLIDLTKQGVDAGTISIAQAEAQLKKVIDSTKAEISAKKAARDALKEIYQKDADNKAQALDSQITAVETKVKLQTVNELDGAKQITALKLEQLKIQLANTQRNIDAEEEAIATGSGSARSLETLKNKRAQQQAAIAKAGADARVEQENIALKLIEQANNKAEAAITKASTDRLAIIKAKELAGLRDKQADAVQIERETQRAIANSQLEATTAQIAVRKKEIADVRAALSAAGSVNTIESQKKLQDLNLDLAKLQGDRIDQEIALLKLAREEEIRGIQDAETIRKAKDDLALARLDIRIARHSQEKAAIEDQARVEEAAQQRILKGLQTAQQLQQSRLDLQKAISDITINTFTGELDALKTAAAARKELDSGSVTSAEVRAALEDQIAAATGSSESNSLAIAQQIADQEDQIALVKRNQLVATQEAARLNQASQEKTREFEQARSVSDAKRAIVTAQLAVIEAQLTAEKVKQSGLSAQQAAQAELEIAQKKQDATATAAAASKLAEIQAQNQSQLDGANQAVTIAQTGVTLAQDNLTLVQSQATALVEIANNSALALEAQQKAELVLFNTADYSRQLAANLELARQAAAQIKIQTPETIPARRYGGDTPQAQVFRGGEVGPELVRYADGSYGLLPKDGLYTLPQAGFVIPADQTRVALSTPTIHLGSGSDRVVSAIARLTREVADLKTYVGARQENTFNLPTGEMSEVQRAAEIALAIARARK